MLQSGMVLPLHSTCLKYAFISIDFKRVTDHKWLLFSETQRSDITIAEEDLIWGHRPFYFKVHCPIPAKTPFEQWKFWELHSTDRTDWALRMVLSWFSFVPEEKLEIFQSLSVWFYSIWRCVSAWNSICSLCVLMLFSYKSVTNFKGTKQLLRIIHALQFPKHQMPSLL